MSWRAGINIQSGGSGLRCVGGRVPTRSARTTYVTLGHWIAGALFDGTSAWVWLGAPPVIALATTYFFALIAIGVGAASVRLPGRTQ